MYSEKTAHCDTCSPNYEAECERLSMIIMRQNETIQALKTACYNLSIVLMQEDTKVTK